MASNDWPFDGEPPGETRPEDREPREPEFEVRDPDLWEELGLQRSDDVPVPTAPPDAAPADRAERDGSTDTAPEAERLGKPTIMAVLSHLSVLFGVPVFLVPLVLRRDSHSLHHAKAAALVYFAFYAVLSTAMFAWPVLTPLAMLLYLPGLLGIFRAVRGRPAGALGFGDLAEWLFPWPDSRDRA